MKKNPLTPISTILVVACERNSNFKYPNLPPYT